jgi:hypothetical protein
MTACKVIQSQIIKVIVYVQGLVIVLKEYINISYTSNEIKKNII